MFYLGEILNIYKKNILISLYSIGTLLILSISISNYKKIEKLIIKKLPRIENEHYFNSLFDIDENIESIKRKMRDLPGVKSIEVLDSKKFSSSLKSLNNYLDISTEEKQKLYANKVMKIYLSEKVSISSINLIREYLVRLSGEDKIILGKVKKKIINEEGYKKLLYNLQKWPLQILIIVFFLFWITSFHLLVNRISYYSFIIENFQRKKNVVLKLLLAHFSLIIASSCLINIFTHSLSNSCFFLFFSLFLFGIGFLNIGKVKWRRT